MPYRYLLAGPVQVLFSSLSLYCWPTSLPPEVYEKCTIIMLISQMRKQSPRKFKANPHPKLTLHCPALGSHLLPSPSISFLRVDHPAWLSFPARLKLPDGPHRPEASSLQAAQRTKPIINVRSRTCKGPVPMWGATVSLSAGKYSAVSLALQARLCSVREERLLHRGIPELSSSLATPTG